MLKTPYKSIVDEKIDSMRMELADIAGMVRISEVNLTDEELMKLTVLVSEIDNVCQMYGTGLKLKARIVYG